MDKEQLVSVRRIGSGNLMEIRKVRRSLGIDERDSKGMIIMKDEAVSNPGRIEDLHGKEENKDRASNKTRDWKRQRY